MTGNQINSFVGNLVEMAKAYEELPGVRQELSVAHQDNDRLASTIMQREEHILRLKAELAEAHALTRKVEAERDEAIGSFLAANDRADKILAFVKATFGSAGALIQAVEPERKPEPIATPETAPIAEAFKSGSYTSGIDETITHEPSYGDPMAEAPLHPAPQGESAAGEFSAPSDFTSHPIASSPTVDGPANVSHEPLAYEPAPEVAFTPSPTPAPSAPTGTGTESDRSSSDPDASPASTGPYVGKKYHDYPAYVPYSVWIDGGGTDADYHWRP